MSNYKSISFVFLGINLVLQPIALSWIWLWFAVPLGAPVVSALHMYGLMMFFGILICSTVLSLGYDAFMKNDGLRQMIVNIVTTIVILGVWFCAAIAHFLLM